MYITVARGVNCRNYIIYLDCIVEKDRKAEQNGTEFFVYTFFFLFLCFRVCVLYISNFDEANKVQRTKIDS